MDVKQQHMGRTEFIGVGRFRILGGPRFRIMGGGGGGGGQGGPYSQQAHDVVTTSMRRNDVASTSFRRHVPTRFLINQCQIIIFLILKYDIIENSRIELRGIVLPVQVGGLFGGGGGGAKGYVGPPLPTPMELLYMYCGCLLQLAFNFQEGMSDLIGVTSISLYHPHHFLASGR